MIIASCFILLLLALSGVSRYLRATEMRVSQFEFVDDELAESLQFRMRDMGMRLRLGEQAIYSEHDAPSSIHGPLQRIVRHSLRNLNYWTLILPKTSISPLSFTRPTTRSPESISSIVSKSMFGLWLTNATGLGPLRLPISD